MEKDDIRAKFTKIKVASQAGVKALHKPFLLLITLAKYSRGEPRFFLFSEIEKDLTMLLVKYGPPRGTYHPEFPFWNLQNDGIWELINDENLQNRKGRSEPGRGELVKNKVMGGLKREIYLSFSRDPVFLHELVQLILEKFIPEQIREDVLRDVGLDCG